MVAVLTSTGVGPKTASFPAWYTCRGDGDNDVVVCSSTDRVHEHRTSLSDQNWSSLSSETNVRFKTVRCDCFSRVLLRSPCPRELMACRAQSVIRVASRRVGHQDVAIYTTLGAIVDFSDIDTLPGKRVPHSNSAGIAAYTTNRGRRYQLATTEFVPLVAQTLAQS